MSETETNARVASPPLAPAEPVIDLAHLGRMTLGEKSLEAEVLALFDRQAGILLARMSNAPPAEVGAYAHTLMGSARGIGAWRVAEAAQALERCAAASAPATLAAAIDRLAAAVGKTRAAISALRGGRA
jgi:Hpt domain